ncbi:MAG: DUF5106 domain-containing protein [Prevotella sp.]|jgi:hypothetical protein|nr:DUF5106 domain-containing protein [Prevotella sp.]
MKYCIPIIIVAGLVFSFCSNNGKPAQDKSPEDAENQKKTALVLPDVPKELTVPMDRANYLVTHYWDNFDFSDTAYIHLPEITEQALADYVQVLPVAGKDVAKQSLTALLNKAEHQQTPKMYAYFTENFKKYLYDPNSPLRNEECYVPVAEYILTDSYSNDAVKEKAKFELEMLAKNKPGQIAADITYTLDSGKTGTLHRLNAAYTLLMFYNPDCHTCAENISYLKQSPVINKLHETGTLKVLTFYPDADLSSWEQHRKDIPASWVNGYDKNQTVLNKKVYDLKAIPTLYLLDKDKRVLLKDVTSQKIEFYLKKRNPMLFSD